MTATLTIIPDGAPELPAEARDHSILASCLEGHSPASDDPIDSWRDVERVVHPSRLALRVGEDTDGPSDFDQATLDAFAHCITEEVSGVKAHPDGWVKTEPQPVEE